MILLDLLFTAIATAASVELSRAGHRWWGLAFAFAAGWWFAEALKRVFLWRAARKDRR